MSLINDMLKDLDGRHADEQVGLSSDIPVSNGFAGMRIILTVLAAVAVLYFLMVYVDAVGLFDREDKDPEKIPEPVSVDSKWLHVKAEPNAVVTADDQQPQVAVEHPDAVPPAGNHQNAMKIGPGRLSDDDVELADASGSHLSKADSSKTDSDPQTRNDVEITTLLQEAEAALQRDHLMTPSQRNAYQLFSAVLVLDNTHPEAVQGMTKIHTRYLTLADEARSRGDRAQAEVFIRRAEVIAPVPDSNRMASTEGSHVSSAYVDSPNKKREKGRKTQSDGTINIQAVTRLSDTQWVDRLRGNGSAAILEEVFDLLEQGRELPLTAHFLADQFVRENQPHQLQKLAKLVSIDSPGGRYVAAQRAIMAGNFDTVKSILRHVGTQNAVAADELRLRSAVCQKMRDYQCAARGYQELVGSRFSDINDWLGAAVSLDALRRNHGALSAYQRVAGAPHPEPAIADFARRRAAELSSVLLRR